MEKKKHIDIYTRQWVNSMNNLLIIIVMYSNHPRGCWFAQTYLSISRWPYSPYASLPTIFHVSRMILASSGVNASGSILAWLQPIVLDFPEGFLVCLPVATCLKKEMNIERSRFSTSSASGKFLSIDAQVVGVWRRDIDRRFAGSLAGRRKWRNWDEWWMAKEGLVMTKILLV